MHAVHHCSPHAAVPFSHKLDNRDSEQVARLICPLGLDSVVLTQSLTSSYRWSASSAAPFLKYPAGAKVLFGLLSKALMRSSKSRAEHKLHLSPSCSIA